MVLQTNRKVPVNITPSIVSPKDIVWWNSDNKHKIINKYLKTKVKKTKVKKTKVKTILKK